MQDDYFASIPVFDSFEHIVDPAFYRPLPEHWFIGFTDVVESGRAVAAGPARMEPRKGGLVERRRKSVERPAYGWHTAGRTREGACIPGAVFVET